MKWALALAVVGASFLPVWRSGMRENLDLWQFIGNHTIWGPPVAYVPEEEYTRSQSFAVDEVERLLGLRGNDSSKRSRSQNNRSALIGGPLCST